MKTMVLMSVLLASSVSAFAEKHSTKELSNPIQNAHTNTESVLDFLGRKPDDSIRIVNRYVGAYQTKEHPKFGEGITEKGVQFGFEDHTFTSQKWMYGVQTSIMFGQYDGSYLFKKGDVKTHSIHLGVAGDVGYGTPNLYAGLRAGHYARTIGLGEGDIETVMRAHYLSFITGGKIQVTDKVSLRAEVEKTLMYKWQTGFGTFDHNNKPFINLALDYTLNKNNTLQLFVKYKEFAQSKNMQKYVQDGKTYYMYEPKRTESLFGLNWRYEW